MKNKTHQIANRDRTHADYLECSPVVWFTRMRGVYWVLDAHIMQVPAGI
ncbi:MAG: hypothetical protein RIE73_17020 [Coleofasciculus sp. C1-SOL-03]